MLLLKNSVIFGFIIAAGTLFSEAQEPAESASETVQDVRIIMKTAKGDLHFTVFASKVPISAANFLNLAKRGFYDKVGFHLKSEFYLQGGDPTGTGRGMVGYYIENEIVDELKHDGVGVLAMARQKKPDTNGSQFFISLAPCPHLDGLYTVFGKLTKGADLLPTIEIGDAITSIEILDSAELLFQENKGRIAEWNRILDMRKELK